MILLMCAITGCSSFDAGRYTQAVLDVNFKNETEEYVKMTGESQEAADVIYADNVDGILTSLLSGLVISEEVTSRGEQVVGEVLKATHYEVGESKKSEDGYTVDVTFEQMVIFDQMLDLYTERIDAYTAELKKQADSGGNVPTEQEINDQVATILFDVLQEQIDHGVTYKKGAVLTLYITEASQEYTIDNSDYQQIISYAMDFADNL